MKKNLPRLLMLVLAMVFCLSGCGETQEEKEKMSSEVLEMPETLKVTKDLPTDYPQTASSYSVEWNNINTATAQKVLLRYEPTESEEWAQGPAFYYQGEGVEESLMIYNEVTPGGLRYSLSLPEFSDDLLSRVNMALRKMRPYEFGGDYSLQNFGNLEMQDFPEGEDLGFSPYTEVKKQVEETMQACGFPKVELYYAESHTAEIMNHNREIYNTAVEKEDSVEEPVEELNTQQEYYYFAYRQVQDGIPFTSAMWPRTTRNMATETVITAIVDQQGLRSLSADGLYWVGDSIEEKAVISPEEALNVYLEDYSKAMHFENSEILEVELNYVVVVSNNALIARPAWIFSIATEKEEEESQGTNGITYIDYQSIAVSADTGVILERETDMR